MIKRRHKPDDPEQIFNILHPWVKQWFKNKFKTFCEPQRYAIKDIHCRKNVLISSPTGSGKTLTAMLSVLNEVVDSANKGILEDKIYCVYINPLKALSKDIEVNLKQPLREIEEIAGKELGIRVAVRTGDTPTSEKQKMLRKPPHILVCTPETLAILLSSTKFINNLKEVQWAIIDEIHALAENKRGVHLSLSMERLARLSSHIARVGLSATISPLEDIAKFLVGYEDGKERDCKIVDVQYTKQLDLKVMTPVKDLINTDHDTVQKQYYKILDKLIQSHKTTLIFTNTRAATERVVDQLKERYPRNYNESNIGAHHGSLSKVHREELEKNLRFGSVKCAVCSTSLELGIDIGFIDLVILLGSPKSVARALQRVGRSGHQLHAVTKGRIMVFDRDDLIECSVILKSAIEKKIDKIHIPTNCLDVLAQQIHGIALEDKIHIKDLYKLLTSSYCYKDLDRKDMMVLIRYLAGEFSSLESRHIYAKIWYDKEVGMIGKRGMMSRVIHMTNIGTIPDQTGVIVKMGTQVLGTLDEAFLERLRPTDTFVLGGSTYQFKFSRGMVAQVKSAIGRPPTIPSWLSEMLPLSFDLANNIGKFRRLLSGKFCANKSKEEILDFIHNYLYVDKNSAESIYSYFKEQFDFATIPSDKRIIIEHYLDEYQGKYTVFHTLFGRRVNDCLSRALAFAISRFHHKDVELGISDNGFYLRSSANYNITKLLKAIKSDELYKIMDQAIENTEVLRRRFRHCAGRALMILRNYKGRTKRVGRQQVSSTILMSAVKRIDSNFPILKEARRETLEDVMDIINTKKVLKAIEKKNITVEEINTKIPSPFAFNLVLQGHMDIMRIEDKQEFLKRMHQMVLAKIGLDESNND